MVRFHTTEAYMIDKPDRTYRVIAPHLNFQNVKSGDLLHFESKDFEYFEQTVKKINDDTVEFLVTKKIDGGWENLLVRGQFIDNINDELFRLKQYISLDNGKWLDNQYGKYNPNLTFVFDHKSGYDWIKITEVEATSMFNLILDGNIEIMYGQYRKSKKGTDVFDLTKKGQVLVKVKWGGAFSKTRGYTIPDAALYSRRASSNGGGTGYTYFIVDIGWKYQLSEDDI